MDAIDQFLLGKGFPFKELFHQCLIGFRHRLTDGGDQTFQPVFHLFRNLRRGHIRFYGIALVVVFVRLHFNQIHIGNDLAVLDHWNHNRAHSGTEYGFQLCQGIVEIGVGIIDLGDDEHLGAPQLCSGIIGLAGAHLDAGFCRNGQHYRIRSLDALQHTAGKVE